MLALHGVVVQPVFERSAVIQLLAFEKARQAREVKHAQGNAGAFKYVVITATAFMGLTLAAAQVDQCDQR